MKLTYGKKITLLRKFAGMQQKELAVLLDTSSSSLSEWEKDKHIPNVKAIEQISAILQMHPAYFFDNILPSDFGVVQGNFKYAYYLSQLPDEVRGAMQESLKHLYEFYSLKEKGKDIMLLNEFQPKTWNAQSRKDYSEYLEKMSLEEKQQ